MLKKAKTLDLVPEEFRADAEETKDGQFAYFDNTALVTAETDLTDARKKLTASEALVARQVRDLAKKDGKGETDAEKLARETEIAKNAVDDYKATIEPELVTLRDTSTKYNAKLHEDAFDLATVGVEPGDVVQGRAKSFRALYMSQTEVGPDGAVRVKGKPGANVKKHLAALAKADSNGDFIVGNQGDGGGPKNNNGNPAPVSVNKTGAGFDEMLKSNGGASAVLNEINRGAMADA